jgi:hypothetical protein
MHNQVTCGISIGQVDQAVPIEKLMLSSGQRLDVEMERMCAYIEQEIEQSTSFREQKLLVAEFGLLDAQLTSLLNMLHSSEVGSIAANDVLLLYGAPSHSVTMIDGYRSCWWPSSASSTHSSPRSSTCSTAPRYA